MQFQRAHVSIIRSIRHVSLVRDWQRARGTRDLPEFSGISSPTNAPAIPPTFRSAIFRATTASSRLPAGRPARGSSRCTIRRCWSRPLSDCLDPAMATAGEADLGRLRRQQIAGLFDHSGIRSRRMPGDHRADLPALCARRRQRRCDGCGTLCMQHRRPFRASGIAAQPSQGAAALGRHRRSGHRRSAASGRRRQHCDRRWRARRVCVVGDAHFASIARSTLRASKRSQSPGAQTWIASSQAAAARSG